MSRVRPLTAKERPAPLNNPSNELPSTMPVLNAAAAGRGGDERRSINTVANRPHSALVDRRLTATGSSTSSSSAVVMEAGKAIPPFSNNNNNHSRKEPSSSSNHSQQLGVGRSFSNHSHHHHHKNSRGHSVSQDDYDDSDSGTQSFSGFGRTQSLLRADSSSSGGVVDEGTFAAVSPPKPIGTLHQIQKKPRAVTRASSAGAQRKPDPHSSVTSASPAAAGTRPQSALLSKSTTTTTKAAVAAAACFRGEELSSDNKTQFQFPAFREVHQHHQNVLPAKKLGAKRGNPPSSGSTTMMMSVQSNSGAGVYAKPVISLTPASLREEGQRVVKRPLSAQSMFLKQQQAPIQAATTLHHNHHNRHAPGLLETSHNSMHGGGSISPHAASSSILVLSSSTTPQHSSATSVLLFERNEIRQLKSQLHLPAPLDAAVERSVDVVQQPRALHVSLLEHRKATLQVLRRIEARERVLQCMHTFLVERLQYQPPSYPYGSGSSSSQGAAAAPSVMGSPASPASPAGTGRYFSSATIHNGEGAERRGTPLLRSVSSFRQQQQQQQQQDLQQQTHNSSSSPQVWPSAESLQLIDETLSELGDRLPQVMAEGDAIMQSLMQCTDDLHEALVEWDQTCHDIVSCCVAVPPSALLNARPNHNNGPLPFVFKGVDYRTKMSRDVSPLEVIQQQWSLARCGSMPERRAQRLKQKQEEQSLREAALQALKIPLNVLENDAATLIQTAYRGHRCYQKYELLKIKMQAVRFIMKWWRKRRARSRLTAQVIEMGRAAVILQSLWRGRVARVSFPKLIIQFRNATKIQRWFRFWFCHWTMLRRHTDRKIRTESEMVLRKKLTTLVFRSNARKHHRKCEAVKRIQRWCRLMKQAAEEVEWLRAGRMKVLYSHEESLLPTQGSRRDEEIAEATVEESHNTTVAAPTRRRSVATTPTGGSTQSRLSPGVEGDDEEVASPIKTQVDVSAADVTTTSTTTPDCADTTVVMTTTTETLMAGRPSVQSFANDEDAPFGRSPDKEVKKAPSAQPPLQPLPFPKLPTPEPRYPPLSHYPVSRFSTGQQEDLYRTDASTNNNNVCNNRGLVTRRESTRRGSAVTFDDASAWEDLTAMKPLSAGTAPFAFRAPLSSSDALHAPRRSILDRPFWAGDFEAAVSIQRIYRGFQSRRRTLRRRSEQAALLAQTKRFLKSNDAAVMVQRFARCAQSRQVAVNQKPRAHAQVIRIQRWWRLVIVPKLRRLARKRQMEEVQWSLSTATSRKVISIPLRAAGGAPSSAVALPSFPPAPTTVSPSAPTVTPSLSSSSAPSLPISAVRTNNNNNNTAVALSPIVRVWPVADRNNTRLMLASSDFGFSDDQLRIRKKSAVRIASWYAKKVREPLQQARRRHNAACVILRAFRHYKLQRTYYLRRKQRQAEEREREALAQALHEANVWAQKRAAASVIVYFMQKRKCQRLLRRMEAVWDEKVRSKPDRHDAARVLQRFWSISKERLQVERLRKAAAEQSALKRSNERILHAVVHIQTEYRRHLQRFILQERRDEFRANQDHAARVIQRRVRMWLSKNKLWEEKKRKLSMFRELQRLRQKAKTRAMASPTRPAPPKVAW